MKRVIIESPFAGRGSWSCLRLISRLKNISYGRACVRDSVVVHGEAPIASHLLLTQRGILRDRIPSERSLGLSAGHAWLLVADATVVYVDLGITAGMREGIQSAERAGVPVIYRSLLGGRHGESARRTFS